MIILATGVLSNKIVFTVLSPEDFGLFGYAVSAGALFFIFNDLQLQNVYFKRIAEGQDLQRHFSTFISLKILLTAVSLCVFSVYACYTLYASNSPDIRMLLLFLIVVLSYLADTYSVTLGIVFLARREAFRSQLIAVATALFNFAYTATLVYMTGNVYIFTIGLVAKSLVAGMLSYYLTKGEISLVDLRRDPKIVKDYLRFITPLLPSTILGLLYDRLDTVLVAKLTSFSEAGFFAAAQKFNVILLLPSASIMTILYSSFSESASSQDFTTVQATSNKATKYVSLIVTMLSIYVFFNTRDFVVLFMSPEYLPTIFIIRIFMIQVILMSVSRTLDSITLAAERLTFVSTSSSLMYVLGIGLNFILIPSELFGMKMLGLQGAGPAMKSLLVYVVSILVHAVYLRSRLNITIYWRFLYHLAGALAAGYLVGIGLAWNIPNVFVLLSAKFVCYAVVYGALMVAVREITRADVRYLLTAFALRGAMS
jgi:O-antigen/teichoic acid export membrane protein